jgi:hypothetical protein
MLVMAVKISVCMSRNGLHPMRIQPIIYYHMVFTSVKMNFVLLTEYRGKSQASIQSCFRCTPRTHAWGWAGSRRGSFLKSKKSPLPTTNRGHEFPVYIHRSSLYSWIVHTKKTKKRNTESSTNLPGYRGPERTKPK